MGRWCGCAEGKLGSLSLSSPGLTQVVDTSSCSGSAEDASSESVHATM